MWGRRAYHADSNDPAGTEAGCRLQQPDAPRWRYVRASSSRMILHIPADVCRQRQRSAGVPALIDDNWCGGACMRRTAAERGRMSDISAQIKPEGAGAVGVAMLIARDQP